MSKLEELGITEEAIEASVPEAMAPDDFETYRDPLEWLRAPREAQGTVTVGEKALKITAVTDAELEKIQQSSKRPFRGNKMDMRINQMVFRRELIAMSVNKAYGFTVGSPNALTQDSLVHLPSGELSKITTEIMKVSGFDTGDTSPEDFFG